MRADKLISLLACYGTDAHDSGEWVRGRCPFAPWLHDGGTDEHPSFGVKVSHGTPSFYQCFTCGQHGELMDMHLELLIFNRSRPYSYEWKLAHDLIENEHEDLTMTDDEIAEAIRKSREPPTLQPYPEEWLQSFPIGYNHPYLLNRGVLPEACSVFDIRWDPTRQRVCFPFRTFTGEIAGMQGRDVTGQSKIRYLTYTYRKRKNGHVWLNEKNVDRDWPIVLVEGPVDAMKVSSVYSNVLAAMTSQITEPKFDRVRDCPALVTFFDLGDAGDKARKRVEYLARGGSVVHVTPPAHREDPGAMTLTELAKSLSFLK